jgi:hypothetical protein
MWKAFTIKASSFSNKRDLFFTNLSVLPNLVNSITHTTKITHSSSTLHHHQITMGLSESQRAAANNIQGVTAFNKNPNIDIADETQNTSESQKILEIDPSSDPAYTQENEIIEDQ